ncbi:PREDICTED: uncharacterized protein F58A4.6-like isoform X2 [Priapulus caudatus]|nr:PREDICTED: uncharacterized protein F58A4.6-like isoform X2 [Priapulus caudatus]
MVQKKRSLDETMAWLSTLGGAYSALGDYYKACAVIAGQLSMRQLRIAVEMGDDVTCARCMVYLAISCMQQWKLRQARDIVRRQWKLGKRMHDRQLSAMCIGVWSRLRFVWRCRRSNADPRARTQSGGSDERVRAHKVQHEQSQSSESRHCLSVS